MLRTVKNFPTLNMVASSSGSRLKALLNGGAAKSHYTCVKGSAAKSHYTCVKGSAAKSHYTHVKGSAAKSHYTCVEGSAAKSHYTCVKGSGAKSPTYVSKRNCSGRTLLYRVMGIRQKKRPDAVQSPRLTPNMVSNILQMNEEAVSEAPAKAVKGHVTNYLQSNKPAEDRHIHGHLLHGGASLYTVIDGHAGCACAEAITQRLYAYIAVAMADEKVLQDICDGKLDPTTDLAVCFGQYNQLKETDLAAVQKKNLISFAQERLAYRKEEESVQEALAGSFVRLDRDIAKEALPSSLEDAGMDMSCYLNTLAIAFSGAVVCMAYIDNTDLFVANTGDSQAVLGVHNYGGWQAVPLSNAHVADNQSEVERITKEHPNESSNIIKKGRLFGELMPLRAFGDVRFKWSEKDLRHLLHSSHIPKPELLSTLGEAIVPQKYHTPPYLDAEPEVMHHKLTPKDKFLVLATDGLWDCLPEDTVVNLVGGYMDGGQVLVNYTPPEGATLKEVNIVLKQRLSSLENLPLDSNAATHLLRSVLGPDHGQVSAQLTLSQSIVRQYRDDITITIVFFDSDYISHVNVKH